MVARGLRLLFLFEEIDLEIGGFRFLPFFVARRREGAHQGDHLPMELIDFDESGAAGAAAADGAESFIRVEARVA
jgi:hypothetical protein